LNFVRKRWARFSTGQTHSHTTAGDETHRLRINHVCIILEEAVFWNNMRTILPAFAGAVKGNRINNFRIAKSPWRSMAAWPVKTGHKTNPFDQYFFFGAVLY
jgi:hypothetical protein